jgi:7,8-dihydroneopterin aldolase/epimerase/oxygenase
VINQMTKTNDGPKEGHNESLDRLTISAIEGFGHHGVFEAERRDGQLFLADLALAVDTRPAASSDDLRDTVDYGSLVARVVKAIESDPVDLIETLAERIAGTCLEDDRVRSVEVTVHKPHAPVGATVGDVALTITRTQSPSEGSGAARD